MDTIDYISWEGKWYCNTEPDASKFEGSPADRIIERLVNGEVFERGTRIEFSSKHSDLAVTFISPNRWEFKHSSWSYTYSEEMQGWFESYEWQNWVQKRREANSVSSL